MSDVLASRITLVPSLMMVLASRMTLVQSLASTTTVSIAESSVGPDRGTVDGRSEQDVGEAVGVFGNRGFSLHGFSGRYDISRLYSVYLSEISKVCFSQSITIRIDHYLYLLFRSMCNERGM